MVRRPSHLGVAECCWAEQGGQEISECLVVGVPPLNTAIFTAFHSLQSPVWVTPFSPAPRLHPPACVDFKGGKRWSISDGAGGGGGGGGLPC